MPKPSLVATIAIDQIDAPDVPIAVEDIAVFVLPLTMLARRKTRRMVAL